MTKKTLLTSLILIWVTKFLSAQKKDDYLLWSATHKLTLDDFGIKIKQVETTPSFGQFTVDYQVNGFNFLTKNFNKKVHNYFIKTASWIDTTKHVQQSLTYQQTLFDICEIYTRQFRKALRENRKKFLEGTEVANQLNKQFVSTFAKRRVDYDRETKFGTDVSKQREWEIQIQKELAELSEYAYDK